MKVNKETITEQYNAGLLNDYGGGDIGWWHNYIRSILDHAYQHYEFEAMAIERISFKNGLDKGMSIVKENS